MPADADTRGYKRHAETCYIRAKLCDTADEQEYWTAKAEKWLKLADFAEKHGVRDMKRTAPSGEDKSEDPPS